MKTRIVETKFWKDTYIVDLTSQEKLIYLYLLTTEKVNIIHCYEITDREISFDTGIDTPIVIATKKKLEKDGKLAFCKNYVCLLNAYKYESYTGPKNEEAKNRLILQLGDDVASWYRGIYRGIAIPPISHKSETISNNSYIKDHNSEDIGEGYIKFLEAKKKLTRMKGGEI
jgi:hypothetical protein